MLIDIDFSSKEILDKYKLQYMPKNQDLIFYDFLDNTHMFGFVDSGSYKKVY